jgi:hypothetical protein
MRERQSVEYAFAAYNWPSPPPPEHRESAAVNIPDLGLAKLRAMAGIMGLDDLKETAEN